MNKALKRFFDTATLGETQKHKNMTVFPIISPAEKALDYLTLDEALNEKLVAITEVSEGGSVPTLKVANHSESPVLILNGEELVGAKQNRIVNTTILIAAKSTVMMPVSCVEQGRWKYEDRLFSSRQRVMPCEMRRSKEFAVCASLRASGSYDADQGEIWAMIDEKGTRFGTPSPTSAMADIFEQNRGSLDGYLKGFREVDGQVGLIAIINDKVLGCDCFGRCDTFSKAFNKLVQSYALDALDWLTNKEHFPSRRDAEKFLEDAAKARTEERPSVSLGTDVRLESTKVIGSALFHDGCLVHLTAFAKGNGTKDGDASRLHNASRRRGLL